MSVLTIPESWHKFILERDNYRNQWIAWAIADDYWFKGMGASHEAAFANLLNRIDEGHHVGKLEPARYAPASGKAYRKATIPPLADIDLSSFDLDL